LKAARGRAVLRGKSLLREVTQYNALQRDNAN